MKLQTIQSMEGKDEYVLLPIPVYRALKDEIDDVLAATDNDYEPFVLDDYVDNPVALARIRARVSQEELAQRLGVSQPYISKIERQDTVTAKLLARVEAALNR